MRRWIFASLLLANLGLLMWGAQFVEVERPQPLPAQEPVNPEKMRLLRETPPNRKPNEPPAAPKNDMVAACYRLGPSLDSVQIQKIEQALAAQSLPYTRRDNGTRTVAGFRVYLPPFSSKDEAEKKRRELTRLGFKDHAVINGEGLDNGISLGLFSIEVNAQNRVSQLAQKGIDAKMESFEQTLPAYSWDVGPIDTPETRSRLNSLLEGIANAEVRNVACPPSAGPTRPVAEPVPR